MLAKALHLDLTDPVSSHRLNSGFMNGG